MNKLSYLSPFDILVKNFFDNEGEWLPAAKAKSYHPVDVYENSEGLNIEVACTGLTKNDVDIKIDGRFITIKHEGSKSSKISEDTVYYTSGISRRSFNVGYKIDGRFDLDESKASLENGLLHISIPLAEASKPKQLPIK